MKVVITGGGGFLGKKLARRILQQGTLADAYGKQQKVSEREQQATKLATDKGFQDALERYNVMPGKQVKQIFMTLDDQTVVNFLQAMEPRPDTRQRRAYRPC